MMVHYDDHFGKMLEDLVKDKNKFRAERDALRALCRQSEDLLGEYMSTRDANMTMREWETKMFALCKRLQEKRKRTEALGEEKAAPQKGCTDYQLGEWYGPEHPEEEGA